MRNRRRLILLLAVAVFTLGFAHGIDAQHKPEGELVWALHVSIAPAWFDPGENGGLITPYAVLDIISPSTWWRNALMAAASRVTMTPLNAQPRPRAATRKA